MVAEFTQWKMKCFKNDNDKGGAMDKAIKSCPQQEIVIHSQTKKTGRLWGYTTPLNLLKLLENNYGIYEVISMFPHKVYFDVDKHTLTLPNKEEQQEFLNTIKNIILRRFPNAEMAISGSITIEKTSYHIVLQNYVIRNENDRTYMRHLSKYLYCEVNDAFDWKVYTKNRNMKCINQSKPDGRVQEIIEDNDFKHHLITCFVGDNNLPFLKLEEKIDELVKIEKAKGIFDLSKLPKLSLKCSDILDYNLMTPLEILTMMPIGKDFAHDYTHLVARFCFNNHLTFENFMAWIKTKHEEKNSDMDAVMVRWQYNWSRLDKFPDVSPLKIKNVLYNFYPHIKKDVHYRQFSESFHFDKCLVQKILTINQSHFHSPEKFSIFNVGMGGGKTFQTIKYLNLNQGKSFVWIAPNKALANNTHSRIIEEKINSTFYLDVKTKDKMQRKLTESDHLTIVANSLHYCFDKKYEIVVIDEIETLLDKWFGTFMQEKEENWEVFKNIFKHAKKIILLDAFITTKTLNLLYKLGFTNEQIKIYERENEPITRKVVYVNNYHLMIDKIIKDLKNGLKLFIFYPHKSANEGTGVMAMESLYEMIKTETNTDGIFYNADIDEKIKSGLKDVNVSWGEKQFIITNSMITCGVNYEKTDFDVEYIFVASFNSPRDIIQVSYRPRHLTSGLIHICYLGKMNQQNTWELDKKEIHCPIYKALIKDILMEKKSPIKKTLQLFCDKARYKQETDKEKISEALTKEIQEMASQYWNCYSYQGIEDISCEKAIYLQDKLFVGQASMREKFELQKFFFKGGFKEEAKDEIYEVDADGKEITVLEHAWNERFLFFSQVGRNLDKGKDSVFLRIKEHNKWEGIFPTGDEMKKKLKLTPEILDQIFKEFKFKYIGKHSLPLKIIYDIYNAYFGWQTIEILYDSNKHATYVSPNNEDLNYFYGFIDKYRYSRTSDNEYDSDFDFDCPCFV